MHVCISFGEGRGWDGMNDLTSWNFCPWISECAAYKMRIFWMSTYRMFKDVHYHVGLFMWEDLFLFRCGRTGSSVYWLTYLSLKCFHLNKIIKFFIIRNMIIKMLVDRCGRGAACIGWAAWLFIARAKPASIQRTSQWRHSWKMPRKRSSVSRERLRH